MRHGIQRPIQSREHHADGSPRSGALRGKFQGFGDAAQGITELAARGELQAQLQVRFRILRIKRGRLAKHDLGEFAAPQSFVGQTQLEMGLDMRGFQPDHRLVRLFGTRRISRDQALLALPH